MFRLRIVFMTIFLMAVFRDGSTDSRPSINFDEEVTVKIYKAVEECISKIGVDQNILQLIRDGSYKFDENVEKFIHCSYVASGYAYDNGRVKVKEAAGLFPKEYSSEVEKVMNNCDKELNDPVQNTFQFFVCFQKNSPVRMGL